MEALGNLQDDIKSKMFKVRINFKKCPKERLNYSYIEVRLENLEQQWKLFYETHVKIIRDVKKVDLQNSTYHKDCVYDEVEEFYTEFKSELKSILSSLKSAKDTQQALGSASSSKMENNIRLPEIKIPMFSGKYIEWQTFRDLFVGLVHNNTSLNDAQKLYYLKGYLTGDADQLLRNINMSSGNYKNCWDKLEAMYNNKRFLANGILKRLLNQKSLTFESAIEIKKLVSTTTDCLESIKNLSIDVSSWDILVIHIISNKLDKETRKAWELHVSSDSTDKLPKFEHFIEFLVGRFRGLENLDSRSVPEKQQRTSHSFHLMKDKKEYCFYCSENGHKINTCRKFCKEGNDARRDFAMERGLCFICLGNNHSAKICKSSFKCQICKRRHHTLLHPKGGSGSVGEGINGAGQNDSVVIENKNVLTNDGSINTSKFAKQADRPIEPVVSCFSTGNCKNTVLLPTALVRTVSKDGSDKTLRALLDQGSQGSFITESMVQYLGLRKTAAKHLVTGVGDNKTLMSKSIVNLKIRSRIDPNYSIHINAYVLKSITNLLPVVKSTRAEWAQLSDSKLADPEYHSPNKIDLLLGADVYCRVILDGVIKDKNGCLVGQNTKLGWILSGVLRIDYPANKTVHAGITVMHASTDTDLLLKKFWEIEAEPEMEKILNKEEEKCEKFYLKTTRRDVNGRYIVRLPFRDDCKRCLDGESRLVAEKRLKGLDLKFAKNFNLKDDYTKVIHEYLQLGHMVKVPKENWYKGLYLPHHAVIREDKETSKVRVVFDASSKGNNGISLNDRLMIGPSLQSELRHVIMRWRRHPICLSADIIKMYRQILVDRRDTTVQRILWRDGPENQIEEFELLTVTFGTAAAPYLAIRTLHQVAYDEAKEYPSIAKIILSDFYMDDLMSGAETIEEAHSIYTIMTRILRAGGFKLHKWISNSQELLTRIGEGKENKERKVKIKIDNLIKILGLTWDPCADVFRYAIDVPTLIEPVSKRKIISDISRLFDPLGWLAPSVIIAKMFIQKLWLAGVDWDEEVPSNLLKEWITYREQLPLLSEIRIPRWLHIQSNNVGVELHGFSDASKLAYAAVIYIRIEDQSGQIHVSLLTSKTKVAPVRQVSIPRLELCGALLTAKLIREVAKILSVEKADCHAWTDSEVVLAWLNNHPSRWKTFVANRTSEILSILDTQHWSYVSSKENPADCASRGLLPLELGNASVWFNGPGFLYNPVIDYKKPKHLVTNKEEVKVFASTVNTAINIWHKYSSLIRLIRVLSYCRRFLNLNKGKGYNKYLSKDELENAKIVCIKRSQEETFAKEIEELRQKGAVSTKGKYKSLNLFIDTEGIVRVGGRLEMSGLDFDRKHPILIGKDSFITKLLVTDAHNKTMHGGPQAMITYLRSSFWIIGLKHLVKAHYRRCVVCIRYANRKQTQLMGQPPSSRVTPSKVFLRSGVDYAGPINIRVSKGRGNKSYKGYIALFICMATRAIHLEVVSDMTSHGFLAAFKRFVARRGRCAELLSDNGSNFVGAARELRDLFHEEKSNILPELAEELATNGTKWSFIPPHAPNFGGLWEAGIKSTKYHLRRVIGNSILTFEEMSTVLAQIEACLNSRPISYMEEQNEGSVLTPAHFLVGEPLVLVPDSNFENENITSLRRWQLTQRMLQDFWRKWSLDYLNQFLQRHRWSYQSPEPSIGDMVLVKEDDLPPGKWLMGVIETKHPGPDEITRVVTIRTKTGRFKRPVSKLCVLPITK